MLENLRPTPVFRFFEEICAIPHGSGNTKGISDYLVKFAKERSLSYIQDEHNNVIIKKPATPGYEDAPVIILQGHMDMVCEKEEDCNFDFLTDGLRLEVDGDFVTAKGTTLGGDDGIAVAYELAILDSDDVDHPELECVFTVDEEIGLLGAAAMDTSVLKGRTLINIDSEMEGILTVSCAGGETVVSDFPVKRHKPDGSRSYALLKVDGLLGGHSGEEINKEHGNAIKLLSRILNEACRKTDIDICSIYGGLKDNAIPFMCSCELMASDDEYGELVAIVKKYNKIYKNEFSVSDPGVSVKIKRLDASNVTHRDPIDREDFLNALFFLYVVPNGVQAMSTDIKGLVETSLSMGILSTGEDCVSVTNSVRSSVNSRKYALADQVAAIAKRAGGSSRLQGDYTPWEYKKNSKLRDLMVDVYSETFGKEIIVTAIHGGLECGVFSDKIPDLDCVSFGPDLFDIHTANERMSISSVRRTYNYLLEVLKRTTELSEEG